MNKEENRFSKHMTDEEFTEFVKFFYQSKHPDATLESISITNDDGSEEYIYQKEKDKDETIR